MLPHDYNFLILVKEHACMIFDTTYTYGYYNKIEGNLCLLTLIIGSPE